MRKHLYRAFRKDSPTQTLSGSSEVFINGQKVCGEWVYGYLASSNFIDEYEEIVFDGRTIEVFKERHAIIPETIEQFTGLTDKNGRDIFEGDVLKGEGEWNSCGYVAGSVIILYSEGAFCGLDNAGYYYPICDSEHFLDLERYEVAGNIHNVLQLEK